MWETESAGPQTESQAPMKPGPKWIIVDNWLMAIFPLVVDVKSWTLSVARSLVVYTGA